MAVVETVSGSGKEQRGNNVHPSKAREQQLWRPIAQSTGQKRFQNGGSKEEHVLEDEFSNVVASNPLISSIWKKISEFLKTSGPLDPFSSTPRVSLNFNPKNLATSSNQLNLTLQLHHDGPLGLQLQLGTCQFNYETIQRGEPSVQSPVSGSTNSTTVPGNTQNAGDGRASLVLSRTTHSDGVGDGPQHLQLLPPDPSSVEADSPFLNTVHSQISPHRRPINGDGNGTKRRRRLTPCSPATTRRSSRIAAYGVRVVDGVVIAAPRERNYDSAGEGPSLGGSSSNSASAEENICSVQPRGTPQNREFLQCPILGPDFHGISPNRDSKLYVVGRAKSDRNGRSQNSAFSGKALLQEFKEVCAEGRMQQGGVDGPQSTPNK